MGFWLILAILFFIIAAALFIAAIVLFRIYDIRAVYYDLSGKAFQKGVESIRQENDEANSNRSRTGKNKITPDNAFNKSFFATDTNLGSAAAHGSRRLDATGNLSTPPKIQRGATGRLKSPRTQRGTGALTPPKTQRGAMGVINSAPRTQRGAIGSVNAPRTQRGSFDAAALISAVNEKKNSDEAIAAARAEAKAKAVQEAFYSAETNVLDNVEMNVSSVNTYDNLNDYDKPTDVLENISEYNSSADVPESVDECDAPTDVLESIDECDAPTDILESIDECDAPTDILESIDECDAPTDILDSAGDFDDGSTTVLNNVPSQENVPLMDYSDGFRIIRSISVTHTEEVL